MSSVIAFKPRGAREPRTRGRKPAKVLSMSKAPEPPASLMPRPKHAQNSDRFCSAFVVGDSLIERGIHDGDVAVVRSTFDATELQQGQLLAVWTPYGLLLKFVYWTLKGKVRLVSANAEYEDLLLDADDVMVQGVVEYTMHYWQQSPERGSQ